MTETRIEFFGRLGDAPKVAIVDGATLAGAPVVSRLPGRDGKCGGDWCLFVSAIGAAGEVLAGCQRDDTVSVVGRVQAVQSIPSTAGRRWWWLRFKPRHWARASDRAPWRRSRLRWW